MIGQSPQMWAGLTQRVRMNVIIDQFCQLNTISDAYKYEPESTLEELQQFSNTEPDPAEEARLDQVHQQC